MIFPAKSWVQNKVFISWKPKENLQGLSVKTETRLGVVSTFSRYREHFPTLVLFFFYVPNFESNKIYIFIKIQPCPLLSPDSYEILARLRRRMTSKEIRENSENLTNERKWLESLVGGFLSLGNVLLHGARFLMPEKSTFVLISPFNTPEINSLFSLAIATLFNLNLTNSPNDFPLNSTHLANLSLSWTVSSSIFIICWSFWWRKVYWKYFSNPKWQFFSFAGIRARRSSIKIRISLEFG